MKNIKIPLITIMFLLVISYSFSDERESSHIKKWNDWKEAIHKNSGHLKIQEAIIIDFDKDMNQKRERKISGSKITRMMDSSDNSFPAGFSLETMPFVFFEIPWKPEDFHKIEDSTSIDGKGLKSIYFSDREVSGELWFNQVNGDLIKTILRFDGKDYPRITVNYDNENLIDSMIILTEPDGGFLAPHFREIHFKY